MADAVPDTPPATRPLVLASSSPRRQELLTRAGYRFVVRPADIDESERAGEAAIDYVLRLAREKADAVAHLSMEIDVVLAADTTVDVDGQVLAKPLDADDARRMLALLSGRPHRVHTGVAVAAAGTVDVHVVTTVISFRALTRSEIDAYVATGEPLDKAGAYGIQGGAMGFVSAVNGSLTNVIGLPLETVIPLLGAAGCRPHQ
ncbi:MAG: nucleoside triphosphate pyrophosphatase [Acidimicrobiia bacterium]